MTKAGKPEKLIVHEKRLDGRHPWEMRQITSEIGILKRAQGSALFKFGGTFALTAVYGPKSFHPKHMQDPQKAVLRCRYSMAPFSTRERIRPGTSRRGVEISKVINQALSDVIFFEDYPKTGIDVFIEILEADASTRCAGLNAASLALADAGIPMKDLISCVSVGKVDGKIVLDLFGLEDNYGDVDMAVATIAKEDKVVLFQMDGIITREEYSEMLKIAKDACSHIYDIQKKTLQKRYETGELNVED
jgi:exosome complex component RRP41